jgi:YkoY family integral membrane protein
MFSFPMLADDALAGTSLGFMGQTFVTADLATIGLLVLLEGVLSIDNALVLGLLAKRVPKPLRKRALTYGLVGAFVFRFLAILMASLLLRMKWVKVIGGGYLIYIAVKHLFFESQEEIQETVTVDAEGELELRATATGAALSPEQEMVEIRERVPMLLPEEMNVKPGWDFWKAVIVIELTDIAFAVDSILAALALVGSTPIAQTFHPKLWVVVLGGIIGLLLMRVAAALFIKLLEKFPRFETAAYLLVTVIGFKLLVDWLGNDSKWLSQAWGQGYLAKLTSWGINIGQDPHVIDFHHANRPEFWIFWSSMLVCLGVGFLPKKGDVKKA